MAKDLLLPSVTDGEKNDGNGITGRENTEVACVTTSDFKGGWDSQPEAATIGFDAPINFQSSQLGRTLTDP